MADIPQCFATYDALVGVVLGAGLTFGVPRSHTAPPGMGRVFDDLEREFEARLRREADEETRAAVQARRFVGLAAVAAVSLPPARR